MEYREFGKLGFKASTFGFGCMRLPTIGGDSAKINEEEAISMIRYAIDNGVNYFDTAYPYHGGNSELVVAKALKDGYRDKIKLASKLPSWLANKPEDLDGFLDLQLKKLEVDYLDFYLLHALDHERWPKLKALGVIEFLDRAKKSGKIKHAAFSFHDSLPVFKEIIDAYDWDMCQIQFNFLDEHYQAGREGLMYAAAKGIPVVVMEPLKGGSISKNVPEDVLHVWDGAKVKRSPVEWAFRWVSDFPEVKVILSGVSSMEQLKENIRIFNDTKPLSLTEEERVMFKKAQDIYKSKFKVGCTGCSYCMPCPSGVAIPDIFSQYNGAFLFGGLEERQKNYADFVKQGIDASKCVECASCENACPQHLSIIEKLKEADKVLSK